MYTPTDTDIHKLIQSGRKRLRQFWIRFCVNWINVRVFSLSFACRYFRENVFKYLHSTVREILFVSLEIERHSASNEIEIEVTTTLK